MKIKFDIIVLLFFAAVLRDFLGFAWYCEVLS